MRSNNKTFRLGKQLDTAPVQRSLMPLFTNTLQLHFIHRNNDHFSLFVGHCIHESFSQVQCNFQCLHHIVCVANRAKMIASNITRLCGSLCSYSICHCASYKAQNCDEHANIRMMNRICWNIKEAKQDWRNGFVFEKCLKFAKYTAYNKATTYCYQKCVARTCSLVEMLTIFKLIVLDFKVCVCVCACS